MKLDHSSYVEPNGTAGGLALWWSDTLDVTINSKDPSHIDTTIDMGNGSDRVHITWIYGSTKWEERLQLWERLRRLAYHRRGSWMVTGDFNEIAHGGEKEEGRPKQQRMMDAFNIMLQDTGLVDMGFKGQPFTWTNNRDGGQRIQERLDRAIANAAWINKFPSTLIRPLPDHDLPKTKDREAKEAV